ncbi:JmjC domain-containing protein [Amycolatopsis sp. NPDC051903]|uniref:JmjC domain-containing protein n=1 Tax=Amycolatopsis sp. NPDC051903 TaxID=3363936 RepID=UPI0037952CC9
MLRTGPMWSNIRLFHEGRDLHPTRYMTGRISDGLIVHSTVNTNAVVSCLETGATLIANHLHETSAAVQRVQEVLEYQLGAKVWIQSYLTRANKSAFGLHRDDHNFVVLQLLGSKSWQVESGGAEPTQRTLCAGDGAFLRAGTEHAVSGVGELSLHLTIAFDWIEATDAQPGSTLSEDERREHARTYRLGSGLPVALDTSTLEPETVLRSAGRTRPEMRLDGDHVEFSCVAGRFRFDSRLVPALEVLLAGGETTTRELVKLSGLSEEQVDQFVRFAMTTRILFCS